MTCPHCEAGFLPDGAQRCPLCGEQPIVNRVAPRRSPPRGAPRPVLLFDPEEETPPRRRWYRLGVALALTASVSVLWLAAQARQPTQMGPIASERALPVAPTPTPEPVAVAPAPAPPVTPPRARTVAPAPPAPRRAAPVERAPGYLSVNTRPWALLSIDGRLIGNTPRIKVRLTPGVHQFRLQRVGFKPYEAAVEVKAGETVSITNITLTAISP